MIRRTSKYLVLAAMMATAASGNAGTATVSPALAACSKALVETLTKNETLPAYTVKAPGAFTSQTTDPNSFTVLAHNARTRTLLAKASCKAKPSGEIVSFKALPLKS
jgi:glutamate/tyrosine decarboxylase-like PLP-dependent enzyme